ncbi:DUF2913 family protein [uncultured Pseudoalteromonas sp.]|uniref:DUF2913 family protein n=1 Tax=uncultured Pseudoalteromonas sp. TaxID=114053 RepID=UPI002597CFAF|nr:DUF2913 family protein [uncultured Pseudoalteromonas sp.]
MQSFYRNEVEAKLIGHVAWCALIALKLAKQNGDVPQNNRIKANKFIANWAKKAQAELRFGSTMNNELDIWHYSGTKKALIAKLEFNIESIYKQYCQLAHKTRKLPSSFKRRILNAGTALQELGWCTEIGLERDWQNEGSYNCTADSTAIILKEHLELFDNVGRFSSPISLMINSNNVSEAVKKFYDSGIILFLEDQNTFRGKKQYNFSIWPNNSAPATAKPMPLQ